MDRIKQCEDLIRKYENLGIIHSFTPSKKKENISMRRDLMIDVSIYDALFSRRPELTMYLLPWCDNIKYIEKKGVIRIRYPVIDESDIEGSSIYELSSAIMGSFWFHKLYTKEADWDAFTLCEEIGGGNFYYKLPGERNSLDDGQLKIVTDSVLAVDALEVRDKLKILVVGCSSEGGCLSGLAYEVISTMVTNSVFDMYDPFTVNVFYKIDTNTFRHYQGEYDYSNVDDYDLVLDDAWQAGKRHNDLDPNENVFEAKNYSVKKLPWDEDRGRSIYRQLFKTETREQRSVSRDIVYNYRTTNVGGDCAACVELRYLLRNDYGEEFERMYMESHRKNCKTGKNRIFDSGEDISYHMIKVKKIPEVMKSKFRRLVWDLDMDKIPVVGENNASLRGSIVLISDEKFLTMRVLKYCPLIISQRTDGIYVIGDALGFGLELINDDEGRQSKIITKKISPLVKSAEFREGAVKRDKIEVIRNETNWSKQKTYKGRVVGDNVISVGIRNYIKVVAEKTGVTGNVRNSGEEVEFIISGTSEAIENFMKVLFIYKAPKCKIKTVIYDQISYHRYKDFKVNK